MCMLSLLHQLRKDSTPYQELNEGKFENFLSCFNLIKNHADLEFTNTRGMADEEEEMGNKLLNS